MNETGIILTIVIAGSIAVMMISLIVRVLMDRRDAAIVLAGNPYPRKFHVFDEATLPGTENVYDFTPIQQHLIQKGFRVVSTKDLLAATSRPWANWPLFVVVTREQGCHIRVFDRYLKPLMVNFVKRRFQRHASELAEQLRKTVEHANSADR